MATLDNSDFVIVLSSESVSDAGNPSIRVSLTEVVNSKAWLSDDDSLKRGDCPKTAERPSNMSDEE
jgi:hypothetical protein